MDKAEVEINQPEQNLENIDINVNIQDNQKVEDIDVEKKQKLLEEERKKRVSTVVEDIKEIDLRQIDNPYELILMLIERANNLKEEKVDILNFHLADITSDYLKLLESIGEIDMEVSADFISIASSLIKIKSEMLLPKPDEDEIEDAEDTERRILIATNEYKLFRDASQKLGLIEDMNKRYREPAPFSSNYRIVLKQMSVDNLIKAFTKMLQKVIVQSKKPLQKIEKDRWTVEDKMFEIETLLYGKDRLNFFDLIEDDYTKGEIINLFLALLELVKKDEISVQQDEMFGDIVIYKIVHEEEKEEEFSITNYDEEED